jgi:hypothetical protein
MADFRPRLIKPGGGQIVFPYTPTISFGSTANYSEYELVHTNYAINAFTNSRPNNIIINAPFYNQTREEAINTVDTLLFLRSNLKMDFGNNATGAPPPILTFSAYGEFNFNNVPVLLLNFDTSYANEIDYVNDGRGNYIPTDMTVNITLLPQYSAEKQRAFSLDAFSNGIGYREGYI